MIEASTQAQKQEGIEAEETTTTDDHEPQQAEFIAYQEDGTLVISGSWVRNLKEGTLTYRRCEMMWNYVDESYNEYSYSYDIDLKADGRTVDHTGKHWLRHAEDAIRKTVELRPRTDRYYRIENVPTNGSRQWLDPDTHHEAIANKIEDQNQQ